MRWLRCSSFGFGLGPRFFLLLFSLTALALLLPLAFPEMNEVNAGPGRPSEALGETHVSELALAPILMFRKKADSGFV